MVIYTKVKVQISESYISRISRVKKLFLQPQIYFHFAYTYLAEIVQDLSTFCIVQVSLWTYMGMSVGGYGN